MARTKRKRKQQRSEAPPAPQYLGRFRLGMVLLSLAVCEILVSAFFAMFSHRFPFPDPGLYVATPEEISESRKWFDVDLGWQAPYDTRWGERPRTRDYHRPFAAAFGDSFTHGDEVSPDHTWCEGLAGFFQADVYNFGVGAYGMDQALLRFERDFPRQPTEVAIFAFISYDIGRNVSVYRKFQKPNGHFVLTKPRFVPEGNGLRLLPNPIRSEQELSRLRNETFLREIGSRDHWYNPHHLPALAFPRLAILFRPAFWRYALRSEPEDLWSTENEARTITERILVRFHHRARALGARPIVVHLPAVKEVVRFVEDGEWPAAVEFLRIVCREQEIECWAPIESARDIGREKIAPLYTQGLRGGHLSVLGNRWIARYLAVAIAGDGKILGTRPSESSDTATGSAL